MSPYLSAEKYSNLYDYRVETINCCIGHYHVLCVVFKVIVRAVLGRLPLTLNCMHCVIFAILRQKLLYHG